jgi:CHAT domain-containing protein
VDDPLNEAKALHSLGQAFQNQGEPQRALDRYDEALALWPKDETDRTNTLHQLGVLYARYLHDERRGRERLLQALAAWRPGQERDKASTLSQLGRLADEQGRFDEARRYYEKALELRRKIDPCGSAVSLARLALVEEKQGAQAVADTHRAEALRIVWTASCPKSTPTVHLLGADLAEKRGDPATALTGYRQAEQLFAGLGDRMLVAESLAGVARNARSLGDLQEARAAGRRALDIVEGVRPTVLSDDLRTSLFSGTREAFDFQIDLLLELGAAEEAWATAEESRARVLQDLLAASAGSARRDAASPQGAQERELQRQLNFLESQRLKASEAKPEKLLSLRQAIDAKIEEMESLRGELRRTGSGDTSLARPEPVTLTAARRELLDGDTVLLEYRLGETASTVWAVTRDAFSAVRLPPRSAVEPAAREAAWWLQSLEWPGHNPPALCNLSRMLLAPVAQHLGRRRLVVVADGALEALPFAALPFPADAAACPQAPLLVDTHEVVSLPSVATLLTQRRLLAGRRPAPGWLAVVADPAYGSTHHRLPGSAQEAADLADLVAGQSPGKIFRATGTAASRQTVTGGALRGFRILHFATHGVFAEQPQLSALDLAEERDAAGRPVSGDLYAHEIYGLDLPAELVVLSACETARGREVRGEGLVSGLPRAFLHAGAARVLVSLWEVEDQSTRDLMVLFYRGLLARNLPPAQALQDAQRTLRQEGRRPNQWAGFVLLGDWRPLPAFSTPR